MSCTLCNDEILTSGNLRPNVATFHCGHEFHLSCILEFAQKNITTQCPNCNEVDLSRMNLGSDRMLALQSLIDARRKQTAKMEKKGKSMFSWFTEKSLFSMVKSGTSLETLKIKGIRPEDMIEEQISWNTLANIYTTQSLLDFGFEFYHMLTMGFQPDHFKLMTWVELTDKLNVRAKDMLKTSITIKQLADLKLEPAKLHELGWRWKQLQQIGANEETIKLITENIDEIDTYFRPQKNEFKCRDGFTSNRRVRLIKAKNGFVF